ncbi:MAG: hypothetical protein WC985_08095 [Thermoplasmata archaeon]
MDRDRELRHLREGPRLDEQPPLLDHIIARCPGTAESALRRCKELLEVVLLQSANRWPSDREWLSLLPELFIAECAPEMTRKEADKYLEWERGLSYEERIRRARKEDAHGKWSVLETVYWFRDEERSWWWWDAVVEDQNTVRVAVEIEGSPYANGALRWILRASGATSAESET